MPTAPRTGGDTGGSRVHLIRSRMPAVLVSLRSLRPADSRPMRRMPITSGNSTSCRAVVQKRCFC